jgi:tetratricopeptide (TPR) repeat protein
MTGLKGNEQAWPLQCLGVAYARLLQWDAAEDSFLAARDALLPEEQVRRAKLGGMAANAALADNRPGAALAALDQARTDATGAGDLALAGELEIDRSRALVALDRLADADAALNTARRDASQNADTWLLSATLARRQGKLQEAQFYIETAVGLSPVDPAVGLEAGVIAVLSGHDDAARKSWQSVIAAAPRSEAAVTAKSYIDQLGGN